MNNLTVYLAVVATVFFIAFVLIKQYIKKMHSIGIVGIDINKPEKPKIAETGGIALLIPLWIGVFLLSATEVFGTDPIMLLNSVLSGQVFLRFNFEYLFWATLITIFSLIGFADDTQNKFIALKKVPWIARAVPMVLVSGVFAWLFATPITFYVVSPLFFEAFGGKLFFTALGILFITGLASFTNTFAGINGMETGSSFIASLGVMGLVYGTAYFPLAAVFSAGMLALIIFNRYPSKVFPGDAGTYLFGSAMAGILIFANKELIGFLLFLPHIADFFGLKMLTNKEDMSESRYPIYDVSSKGVLSIPKYQGAGERLNFVKVIIKIFGPATEKTLTYRIWAIVAINAVLVNLLNLLI
ncbi:MAG: hypothetical protein J7K00_05040 [Candidatus Diapherotrites archaeon]|nr:hypothetical protein [Candidatus Diapherotrites archaeon]